MKRIFSYVFFILLFLNSCSSDNEENEKALSNFIAIGEEEGTFYEFSFDASTNQASTISLTDELGLNRSALQGITFADNIISFYDRNQNEFSASQKDLSTGAFEKYESYFSLEENEFLIWNVHSPQHIYVGYEKPIGSGQVYVRIIDRQNKEVNDILLATISRASLTGLPMYFNQKLFISFVDEGIYKTIVFNINTLSVDDTIVYEDIPFILKNTNGNLSIFQNSKKYFEYDLTTFNKIKTRTLGTIPPFLSFGNLTEPIIHNNIVYYRYPAAQPSFLRFYPGIFDINTQENTFIDVNSNINISFEPLQETRFLPLAVVYDITNEVFLVGFTADYLEGTKGIMIFDKNKKLIDAIELPFSPFKILLN
ncbi:hypothetical protein [Ascidiimonas sp. W6]|uniref:hypothetical protein n=1 Tax=Ascidiimonas meishanensis TaxID=3128903 RepID=UPI0030EB964D